VPYEFSEAEPELEPHSDSLRGGGPPRKHTGIGVLDPAVPPRAPEPLPSTRTAFLVRVIAALLLAGLLGAAILIPLFSRR